VDRPIRGLPAASQPDRRISAPLLPVHEYSAFDTD
jgi:hypothetical protein